VEHFEAHREVLSEESQVRLAKNPLRILDSKAPQDRPIADTAPGIDDFLTPAAGDFFAQVTAGLDAAGVQWTRNARLVRGLDYYRHTAFEFITDRLGAQGTVLAGGRYDGLIESLGGPHTPAVGWAAGIERLAMMLSLFETEQPTYAVVIEDDALQGIGIWMTNVLRRSGSAAELVSSGAGRKRFDKALKLRPKFVISFNTLLLDEGQVANMRVKQLTSGAKLPFRQSELIAQALGSRFRYELPGGQDVDSGADVKLFPRSGQA